MKLAHRISRLRVRGASLRPTPTGQRWRGGFHSNLRLALVALFLLSVVSFALLGCSAADASNLFSHVKNKK